MNQIQGNESMKKCLEDVLEELYSLDEKNAYKFTFYGGTQWEVRNKTTQEGLYTDGGLGVVKHWLLKDIKKNENK